MKVRFSLPIGILIFLMLTGFALAGCAFNIPIFGSPSPTPASPQPLPTATPTALPSVTASPEPTPPQEITLTIWTSTLFSPHQNIAGEEVLHTQSASFQVAYPDIALEWVVKPAEGPGSLTEFLLSAQEVAPTVLPDLVVLDSRALGRLAGSGVLQPLDGVLDDTLIEDGFSFARQASFVDDQWLGVPIDAQIEHLIYGTNRVDAPPLTWSDLLAEEQLYAFPAGGRGGRVNDAFLIQYLALGGRLSDDAGQPFLDETFVSMVLSFYANGARAGVLPDTLPNLSTHEDALVQYQDGSVAMVNITSDLYLANREKLTNTSFASIPTWNGSVATVGRAGVFAVVTPDPSRQLAIKAFIEWILEPERNAAWTRAAGRLPVREAVVDLWEDDQAYTAFARWQLASAFHVPSAPQYDLLYAVLQQAVREVMTQGVAPEDAARRAIATLER